MKTRQGQVIIHQNIQASVAEYLAVSQGSPKNPTLLGATSSRGFRGSPGSEFFFHLMRLTESAGQSLPEHSPGCRSLEGRGQTEDPFFGPEQTQVGKKLVRSGCLRESLLQLAIAGH
eukprot:s49_g68.t1